MGPEGSSLEISWREICLNLLLGTRGDQYYWTCTSQPGVLQYQWTACLIGVIHSFGRLDDKEDNAMMMIMGCCKSNPSASSTVAEKTN